MALAAKSIKLKKIVFTSRFKKDKVEKRLFFRTLTDNMHLSIKSDLVEEKVASVNVSLTPRRVAMVQILIRNEDFTNYLE